MRNRPVITVNLFFTWPRWPPIIYIFFVPSRLCKALGILHGPLFFFSMCSPDLTACEAVCTIVRCWCTGGALLRFCEELSFPESSKLPGANSDCIVCGSTPCCDFSLLFSSCLLSCPWNTSCNLLHDKHYVFARHFVGCTHACLYIRTTGAKLFNEPSGKLLLSVPVHGTRSIPVPFLSPEIYCSHFPGTL